MWTHGTGLEIIVHGVGVTSRDWLLAEEPDVGVFLEDDDRTQSWVTRQVEAVNGTGEVLSWYPDHGEFVVGDEQRSADLFFSGDVGHTAWQPDTRRQDQVVFPLHADWETVIETRRARYLVNRPSLSDTFDPIGEDADISLSWER